MNRGTATNVITYAVLGTAAGLTMLLPDSLTVPSAKAAGSSTEIRLTGKVSDFLASFVEYPPVRGSSLGVDNVLQELLQQGTGR